MWIIEEKNKNKKIKRQIYIKIVNLANLDIHPDVSTKFIS